MNDNKSDNVSLKNTKVVTEKQNVSSQLQIIKNLVVICIGFILLFTGYNGLSMLQSTINQNQGIGVASQAIIYAGFFVSAMLFPKYTIKKLGCKNALLLSMSCYIPYVAANFYFNWYTMVPSAILVGLAASVLWSSNCTYLNRSSEVYSELTLRVIHDKDGHCIQGDSMTNCCDNIKDKEEICPVEQQEKSLKLETLDSKTLQSLHINQDCNEISVTNSYSKNINEIDSVRDYGINTVERETEMNSINFKASHNVYMGTQDVKKSTKQFQIDAKFQEERSKIISSVTARFFGFAGLAVRSSDVWSNLMSYYVLQDNIVLDNITENGNCSCGASFCNVESNCFEHNLAEPSAQMRNILTGVSVALTCLGVILVYLFLDDLETDKEREPVNFSFSLALATLRFIRKKEAILLLLLSSYIGLQQGFYIGDFTKSYIACAWGVYHVGLVTMAYGAAGGIAATVSGILVKYIGRIPVLIGGGMINAGINIYMLIWNPLPDEPAKFFISAALWGVSVGIIWSQLRAFYGVIFKDEMEAAYAGFYFWDSVGYCLSFSYSSYICTYIKIYILLAVSTLGIAGYLKTELLYRKSKNEFKN